MSGVPKLVAERDVSPELMELSAYRVSTLLRVAAEHAIDDLARQVEDEIPAADRKRRPYRITIERL